MAATRSSAEPQGPEDTESRQEPEVPEGSERVPGEGMGECCQGAGPCSSGQPYCDLESSFGAWSLQVTGMWLFLGDVGTQQKLWLLEFLVSVC